MQHKIRTKGDPDTKDEWIMQLLPGSLTKLLVAGYVVILLPLSLALSANVAAFSGLADSSALVAERAASGALP